MKGLKLFAKLGAFGFLAGGIGIPLIALGARGSFAGLSSLADPVVLSIVRVTLVQAILSTLISGLIGFPLGLWVGTLRSPWVSRVCRLVLALPFGIPGVVAAMTWVVLLGRSGLIPDTDILYSLKAVILAHAWFNIPWVALWVAGARAEVSDSQWGAARTLGAKAWARTRFVIWPQVRWALGSSLCQVFSLCVMSFALVLLLGGGPPVETLETSIYARIRLGELDLSGALACAFWQLALTITPWLVLLILRSRSPRVQQARVRAPGRDFVTQRLSVCDFLVLAACLVFLVPYLAAVHPTSLIHALSQSETQSAILQAARISVLLALSSALLAVVAALLTTWVSVGAKWISVLAALPSGISALVLSLGFWLAYRGFIHPFEGSFFAIIVIQSVGAFPWVYRIFWSTAQARDQRLWDQARTLGADPMAAFLNVEWPRWKSPIAQALGLATGVCVGELAAVSLFYQENLIPLPLLLSRWMGQYRFEDAQAASTLLVLLSFVLVGVVMSASQLRKAS